MSAQLEVTKTAIPGVLVLAPRLFGDARGFFLESFNQKSFEAATGLRATFVQDNHSRSSQGVLRGLHYQLAPHAQGKLIRVTQGSVFDVAVDIRSDSSTFGQWVGVELSAENHRQMWIPPGLAHGFLVTSESADVLYKATDFYQPAAERCLIWNDADLGIAWPEVSATLQLSGKDLQGESFKAFRDS